MLVQATASDHGGENLVAGCDKAGQAGGAGVAEGGEAEVVNSQSGSDYKA